MKKCPYCAEEIQGEAIYCRFCGRKVTGILFRKIVVILLVLALVGTAVRYRAEIASFFRAAKAHATKLSQGFQRGIKALEDFKGQPDYAKEMERELKKLTPASSK